MIAAGRFERARGLFRDPERDHLFRHAGRPRRARIIAAMSGIDDDDAAPVPLRMARLERHCDRLGRFRRDLLRTPEIGKKARAIRRHQIEDKAMPAAALRRQGEIAFKACRSGEVEDDARTLLGKAAVPEARHHAAALAAPLPVDLKARCRQVDDQTVGIGEREDLRLHARVDVDHEARLRSVFAEPQSRDHRRRMRPERCQEQDRGQQPDKRPEKTSTVGHEFAQIPRPFRSPYRSTKNSITLGLTNSQHIENHRFERRGPEPGTMKSRSHQAPIPQSHCNPMGE